MSKLQRGIKSLKSIVAIGAAICCSASAWAASEYIDENGLKWTYTASSGKATLSNVVKADGSALTGTLTLPATINGATVTAIGANAFVIASVTKSLMLSTELIASLTALPTVALYSNLVIGTPALTFSFAIATNTSTSSMHSVRSTTNIYLFFFRLLSSMGYYKILSIVPCDIQ